MHFLSLANTSLGRFALFGLALSSAALLRVGWRGGFSSHIVYTCPLERLASSCWVFFVLQGVFQTPWLFSKKLEDSALLLRVVLLVLAVQCFPGEAPKLSENFLIVLPVFSRKGFSGDVCKLVGFLHTRWLRFSLPVSSGGLR